MLQAQSEYTPSQVLDAGRRAEANGHFERATQFYRHLTEFHGQVPEAAGAREALERLGAAARRPVEANGAWPLPVQPTAQPPPPPRLADVRALYATAGHPGTQGVGTQGGPPPAGYGTVNGAAANSPQPPPRQPREAAPEPEVAVMPVMFDQARRARIAAKRYRAGRLLARILGSIGWTGFALGCLLLISAAGIYAVGTANEAILPPQLHPALPMAIYLASVGGVGFVLGLVLVFAGQTARALFDTANAAQELVAMGRMRLAAPPAADRRGG